MILRSWVKANKGKTVGRYISSVGKENEASGEKGAHFKKER